MGVGPGVLGGKPEAGTGVVGTAGVPVEQGPSLKAGSPHRSASLFLVGWEAGPRTRPSGVLVSTVCLFPR